MRSSLTLNGSPGPRILSFVVGLGMVAASGLTLQYFFNANYPASIWEASRFDFSEFFTCKGAAFSRLAQIAGVPLGYFGLIVGALVSFGAVFPSEEFERTNRAIALVNLVGVVALFSYSVIHMRNLCPLCGAYGVFSVLSSILFWKYGAGRENARGWVRPFVPSLKHVAVFAVVLLAGAYGLRLFHAATKEARSDRTVTRMVEEYFSLPAIRLPSVISPYWTVRSTERFEDAPIQVVEYADLLCSDSLYLFKQIQTLREEFKGQINVVFQFFPLDTQCNSVVPKNKHPGACEISFVAAHDPAKFQQIHDEVFANLEAAKKPEWRQALVRRYGLEAALTDPATRERVLRIANTGAEYEPTSAQFVHGVRSTPTMILNNRMLIGTFSDKQLRPIFRALVNSQGHGNKLKYLEGWVPESR